jgi:hypothetical protein
MLKKMPWVGLIIGFAIGFGGGLAFQLQTDDKIRILEIQNRDLTNYVKSANQSLMQNKLERPTHLPGMAAGDVVSMPGHRPD